MRPLIVSPIVIVRITWFPPPVSGLIFLVIKTGATCPELFSGPVSEPVVSAGVVEEPVREATATGDDTAGEVSGVLFSAGEAATPEEILVGEEPGKEVVPGEIAGDSDRESGCLTVRAETEIDFSTKVDDGVFLQVSWYFW